MVLVSPRRQSPSPVTPFAKDQTIIEGDINYPQDHGVYNDEAGARHAGVQGDDRHTRITEEYAPGYWYPNIPGFWRKQPAESTIRLKK